MQLERAAADQLHRSRGRLGASVTALREVKFHEELEAGLLQTLDELWGGQVRSVLLWTLNQLWGGEVRSRSVRTWLMETAFLRAFIGCLGCPNTIITSPYIEVAKKRSPGLNGR